MANPKGAWREPKIPYNDDAARWVLGAILADPSMYQQLAPSLLASDFYPTHRAIWEAMGAIVAEGGTPDELAVMTWLERHGRLGAAGGPETIMPLSTGVPPNYPYAAAGWAKTLLQDAECRAQYDLGNAYVQASQRPLDAAPRAEIARQEARLLDIQRRMRGEDPTVPTFEPLGVDMADVAVETFDWLWHGRVAFGKLTTFDGDGGVGKSLATIDLVARAAMCRAMPDGSCGLTEPTGAILICGEDGLADTVKPRLLAAGVSPDAMHRIRAINLVPEPLACGEVSQRLISLLDDLPQLEATIEALGARLLVIDPISAYLGDTIDMYKDSQVRRVLTPLALMSERRRLAVIMTRHLNRSSGASPQHRGLGSVAFLNVARLGLLFVPNPDAEGEILVSRYKGNITAPPPTLAYRVVQVGEAEHMPRLSWLGERETSAETALAAQMTATDAETRSATDEATEWLRAFLADGPRPADTVMDEAKEANIIPDEKHDKPLRTARARLGITLKNHAIYREGGIANGGRWMWRLPCSTASDDTPRDNGARSRDGGHLSEKDASGRAAKLESKGTLAKMPMTENQGHLSSEKSPKMPFTAGGGHLSADAALNGTDDLSDGPVSSKMPSLRIVGQDSPIRYACPLCDGTNLRNYGDGPRCFVCDELAVQVAPAPPGD